MSSFFSRFSSKKEKKEGKEAEDNIERIHIGSETNIEEEEKAAQQLDILGYSNDGRRAYGIYSKDRVHIGLFGETGAGKSVTIGGLVYQNIVRNEGFMIIDPHGDLSRETLAAIPDHLKDKVIYINAMSATPQWFGKTIKINPIECKDPKDRHIVAMTFVNALKNMYYKSWGDRLEAILRNSVNALVEMEGTTLWDLSRIISTPKYLAQVIRTINSPSTINFLQNVLPAYKKDAGSAAYNKIDKILTTPLVAAMFDSAKSSFDMGQAMNEGMFIIADLSSGMSDDIADFIGSILLNMVYVEAMRRVDVERSDRKPFYLYVDEAHRFSPAELESLLTTVRKFNVKVTLASQTINNFPIDTSKSFGALCKTIILFKSDSATAKMFETVMPISPDEITSLSLNTFAFYSQAQPPITGVAVTALVLSTHTVADWRERAYHSVEHFGTKADLDKYMPTKKKSYVPNWQPLDIKIIYLLRTSKMTKDEILTALIKRYGEQDVDSEAIDKSIEVLRLEHVINKTFPPEAALDPGQAVIALDYGAYHRFFDTKMIGTRTGKEKHKAAIIYLAETFWNQLKYCRIDLGDAHEQLADVVVIDEVQFTDSDGNKRYDLQMWGDATAIEIETDPLHREEQVVKNHNKNIEQGFKVHFIVFEQKDKDTIRRFLTEKRGIAEETYQTTIMDLAEVERFRKAKVGNSNETVSGTGGISPEEMKVIREMRGEMQEKEEVKIEEAPTPASEVAAVSGPAASPPPAAPTRAPPQQAAGPPQTQPAAKEAKAVIKTRSVEVKVTQETLLAHELVNEEAEELLSEKTDAELIAILKTVPSPPQAVQARKIMEYRGFKVHRMKKGGYAVLR